MSIERALAETRPRLTDVNMSQVNPRNISDPNDIFGRIAEQFVFQWLSTIGFDFMEGWPLELGVLNWVQKANGVRAVQNGNHRHEFDFVGEYNGVGYVVEVKAMRLNGFSKTIGRALDYGRILFGEEAQLVIFSPHYHNKDRELLRMMDTFPDLMCVDTGYKLKQLRKSCDRFYRERT